MSRLTVRSLAPTPSREAITARCAQLVAERSDCDPTGCAYEAKTLQLDAALSALFLLGPKDPWMGDPA